MARQAGRNERRRGRRGRIVGRREVRQRFLIVCEGGKTEPGYFRSFQVPGVVVEIRSTTDRGLALINEAIQRRTQDEYDQTWCVFDRDDLPDAIIRQAFNHAKKKTIQTIGSHRNSQEITWLNC